ncbi:hypothetical protein BJX64DRAFT_271790 [Aspergillus heterothallicus]
MRPLSACLVCRERRKRCERAYGTTSCNFCKRRRLECLMAPKPDSDQEEPYELLKHHSHATNLHSAAGRPLGEGLIVELADLYFDTLQGGFPYLFHRATFMDDVRDGSVPMILLYGVIGLSARFSADGVFGDVGPWQRGRPYVKEAERMLDLHHVTLTTIQACVLLAINFAIDADSAAECVYLAIASRMALLLDLPNASTKSPLEKELNHRVWWSIVTTDTWCSANLCLPRAIPLSENVPLLVDERTFSEMQRDDLVECGKCPDESVSLFSPLAHLAKLNKLLYEIHQLNTKIANDCLSLTDAHDAINGLGASLDRWSSELPQDMQYTQSNMAHWTAEGFGNIFATLHINYNHASQLLFYQFLYPSHTVSGTFSTGLVNSYAIRCKQHAAALCDLIFNAREAHALDLRFITLGHIVVIASTVHIHSLLFSTDEEEIRLARLRLERNFETITRLHTYWPTVSASFSRLQAFHRACLKSTKSSFRLDRWMLRFMLEFSQPMDERVDELAGEADTSKPFGQLQYLLDR